MEEVTYKKVIFKVRDGILDLSNSGIKKISEVKGLDNLVHLEKLNLISNLIIERKGLE